MLHIHFQTYRKTNKHARPYHSLKKTLKHHREDDSQWPAPDRVGRQELEVVCGNEHISFVTSKIGSLVDVEDSKDAEGLKIFYFLVQDLRWFFLSFFLLFSFPFSFVCVCFFPFLVVGHGLCV